MATALADASTRRAHAVADHIARRVQTMECGAKLGTKKELCAELGVAPATFNEGLRLLQERRLVVLKSGPQGGVFVAEPDAYAKIGQTLLSVRGAPNTVEQAVAVRDELEEMVLLDAAAHRSDEDLVDLRARIADIEAAVGDDMQFLRAIWRLHERIAACGANAVLRGIYLSLLAIVEEATQSIEPGTKPPSYKKRRIAAHAKLVDAIESQDPSLCRKAIRDHAKH